MTTMDEGFGELVDLDTEAMHGVGKAANGTSFLVAKAAAADEHAGLLDTDLVRELVAKAEAEERPSLGAESVTLSGSPAAVADMMARVAVAGVYKAQMSAADINDLPDSAFAYIQPGGEKDADGKTTPRSLRHYPVHDEPHAKDALGRAQAQIEDGKPENKRIAQAAMPKIRAAARKFGVGVAKAMSDGTEPGSPAWESADAANAEKVLAQILAAKGGIEALAAREGLEVAAGHMDDLCDVWELQGAIESLMSAAKTLAGFALSEHAEAGETGVAKAGQASPAASAAPSPKESTMTQAQETEVAKTEDAAAAGTGLAAVSKAAELAEQLGISPDKLAEIGAQTVLKAAAEAAAAQTSGAAVAPAESARVIPGTDTVQSPVVAQDEVVKAMAGTFATVFGEAVAPVVKQLGELTTQVGAQTERVEKMAAQPDNRRSPLLNGATGEPQAARRGGPAASPEFQAVLKAIDEMPEGPGRDEAKHAVAIAAIKARFTPS